MNANHLTTQTRTQTSKAVVGFLLLASVLIVASVVFAGARWLHGVWQARHALDSASVTLQQIQQMQDVVKWSSFVMRRIGLRELMGLAFVLGFWGANPKTKKTMLFFLGVLCLTALLPAAFDIPLASLAMAKMWMPFVLFLFGVFTMADIRVPRNKAAMGLVLVAALACAGAYLYAYYRTAGPTAALSVEQKFTEPWTVFGSMAWKEIAAMLLLLFPLREWIAIGALQERETGFYTIAGFVYGGITLAAFLWLTRGFRQQDLPMLFYLNAFVSLYAFIAQKIGNSSEREPVPAATPADGGTAEASDLPEDIRQMQEKKQRKAGSMGPNIAFNKKQLLWGATGLALFGVALILIYLYTEDPKNNLYAQFGLLVYLQIPFWISKEQKTIWKVISAVAMIALFVFLWRLPTWDERMRELGRALFYRM